MRENEEREFSSIKIERILQVTFRPPGKGLICIAPADTVYFTVPAKLVQALREKYGIDLQNRLQHKRLTITPTLVKERVSPPDTSDDPYELRIIFTIVKV